MQMFRTEFREGRRISRASNLLICKWKDYEIFFNGDARTVTVLSLQSGEEVYEVQNGKSFDFAESRQVW